jgi:acyl-CoA dehydrogenase-like protein
VELDLSEDQQSLMQALESVIGRSGEPPRCVDEYFEDADLDSRLAAADFFAMSANGFSALDAAIVAMTLARLPACVEAAASLLVLPLLPEGLTRPLAIGTANPADPIRFLSRAATVLIDSPAGLYVGALRPGDVEAHRSFFAYPYGRLTQAGRARLTPVETGGDLVRSRVRLAIAAEIAGALQGALDATVRQVKDRRQFGRAIGSFQAVQHRLASAAQVVAACRMLVCQAAFADSPLEAATALAYAQDCARQPVFDFHQFSGAMGLTLEYPLHLWTYRIRALLGELQGAAQQALAASEMAWPLTAEAS